MTDPEHHPDPDPHPEPRPDRVVGGPFFDHLEHGRVFDRAPSVTLTDGLAATHQAILGDRLRLPLDHHLARRVAGGPLSHPGMVADLAIGQSTLATHHVRANLFYRGLRFHRLPKLGDTLSTRTTVVGLKRNTPRPDRPATGLAALRITTTDQHGRTVLDFHRCAMLPLSPDAGPHTADHSDDLSRIGTDQSAPWASPPGWDIAEFRRSVPGAGEPLPAPGTVLRSSGDVVSSAPELARLTLNIAATHHDSRAGGQRLVYGGHTIGLALAQATRLLPNLVTVLGWESCDHTGPVYEGDTLYSELHIEAAEPLPGDRGGVLRLRSLVHAVGDPDRQVLDWRFTALLF